jgi:3-oxo-5-alpha-steroid 4-dehydrogenase 1
MVKIMLGDWNEQTFHTYLALTLLASGICAFVTLLLGRPAPYGRHVEEKGWGPLVDARLAWFLMESPNLYVSAVLWKIGDEKCKTSLANNLLLGLFLFHYVNRSLIYPLQMPATSTPMPLSVMLMAYAFCCCNAYLQARELTMFRLYPESHLSTAAFQIGVSMFIVGWCLNIHSDGILRKLKKQGEGQRKNASNPKRGIQTRRQAKQEEDKGGKSHYQIPRGGLFEYISGANFFSEIIEWTGYAVCCGGSVSSSTFALFTFLNIGPRAIAHHKWYTQKFEDYPKNRKALIPFLI